MKKSAKGCLALIILLDQFTRNIYRDTPKAFEFDSISLSIAKEAITLGRDTEIDKDKLAFIYMPFMHSEKLSDQKRAIELFEKANLVGNIKYAIEHHDIIKRFNRFPHRNVILGRESSEEEMVFLRDEHSGF